MTGTQFDFATARRIVFGPGTVRQLPDLARGAGKSAMIVTGRRTGPAERLCAMLREEDVPVGAVFSVVAEPDVETVRTGVATAKKEACDFVIALGGGSVLDAGKAIAAMIRNPGDVADYLEIIGAGKSLAFEPAPSIAVPTTAGTGSEVTRNAVIASPGHKLKVSLRSPLLLRGVALVDPDLTYDLPPAITAMTGMDALTQLIEPFVCSRANPLVDSICRDGIRRAARSLKAAFRDGRDAEARRDMSLASLYGGLALTNAGLGAVHGFAGPLGGMFPAPHGALCAVLLPYVMEANLKAMEDREPANPAVARYHEVGRLLSGNATASAADGVFWVRALVGELGIPKLSAYGITAAHVEDIIPKAANASSMKANPIALTTEELRGILDSAI